MSLRDPLPQQQGLRHVPLLVDYVIDEAVVRAHLPLKQGLRLVFFYETSAPIDVVSETIFH